MRNSIAETALEAVRRDVSVAARDCRRSMVLASARHVVEVWQPFFSADDESMDFGRATMAFLLEESNNDAW